MRCPMADEENNNGVFHNQFPEMNKIKKWKILQE